MLLVITYEDRKLVEDELSRDIKLNPKYGLAAYKLFYNLLLRIDDSELRDERLGSDTPTQEQLSDAFNQILQLAFKYATETEKPLFYTTGQMAAYFGVSITTINNWLRDKRIDYPGLEDKHSYKQARIPDSAIYRATNGKETVVREIIQEYEHQKALEPVYDEVERVKSLVQTLVAFETKYGGKYEEVVKRLGDPNVSDDWRWARDADEWRYVMKEIARER